VLLFGAGPTGQVLAQLVKLTGAARLVVAAPAGPKLDLAAKLAADDVVPIDRQNPEVHRKRLQKLSPNGFDYVIEATGAAPMCEEALHFVRRRGTLLVYGVYPEKAFARFNPFDLFRGEDIDEERAASLPVQIGRRSFSACGWIPVRSARSRVCLQRRYSKQIVHECAAGCLKVAPELFQFGVNEFMLGTAAK
jgi:NADPH:quinone reductase-like Zn-dependent oxidoreductase